MNDELPPPFHGRTPRPASAALRARVLDAVVTQLDARARPRWERTLGCAVAAAMLLGIGLNSWQQRAEAAWQMQIFGAAPTPRAIDDVARAVASVTDEQTGLWVRQRLSTSRAMPRRVALPTSDRFDRLTRELIESSTYTKS